MTLTGNKSSETILGSHACRFDKLENLAIIFWKNPTFTGNFNDRYGSYVLPLLELQYKNLRSTYLQNIVGG